MVEGLFLLALSVYFLPTIIAASRWHPNLAAILVVDLFLGWSLIGWVVALAWSLSAAPKPPAEYAAPAPERAATRASLAPVRPALVAADPLAGGRVYPSHVAGLRHADPESGVGRAAYARARVHDDDELMPVREPANPHDPKAVRLDHGTFPLGYIPRRHDWIADALDEGATVRIFVDRVDVEDLDDPRIDIAVVVWS